jgi:hypothetical protein
MKAATVQGRMALIKERRPVYLEPPIEMCRELATETFPGRSSGASQRLLALSRRSSETEIRPVNLGMLMPGYVLMLFSRFR